MNNNWLLGFSLSAQDQLQDHNQSQNSVPHHLVNFNGSDEISGGGAQISATDHDESSCFDHLITSDNSPIPSLNQLPMFQAFSSTAANPHHTQDWNMNSFSCSSSHNLENNNSQPKLENFLGFGGHTFADQLQEHKKLICNNSYQLNDNSYSTMYQQTDPRINNDGNNNSTIGLSMIKNWLRNNPSAAPPPQNKSGGGGGNALVETVVGSAQTLSLSMSSVGPQSPSPNLPLVAIANIAAATESCTSDSKDGGQSGGAVESVTPRKSADTFGQRTSIYRGVTRHRWTGRYEAHLWDNSCRREGQTRKGRQVYLGGYDKEDKAARSYDLAALKYWGTTTTTNFPISNYEKEIEEMKHMTRQEYVASLRRKSSGFSRGASIYRGVTRHHQHGRWQARIGRVAGNKDLYLGTFTTQEEAAEAYDIAAIKFRGLNAVTNFEINRYDVKSIMESTTLPIGGAAKRLKDAENAENMALELQRANNAANLMNFHHLTDHGNVNADASWPTIAFQQAMYPYNNNSHQRLWCKQEQDSHNSHGGFSDINHQLQLGNNTHNFLQPYMVEQSSVSNAGVYGNSDDDRGNGFAMPMMGTVVVQDNGGNNIQSQAANGYNNNSNHVGNIHEGMFGSTADHAYNQQQARNFYYHQSQELSSSSAKANSYDHEGSNNCGNWNSIPTAVPTLAVRNISNGDVDSCHGASTFTGWNDT